VLNDSSDDSFSEVDSDRESDFDPLDVESDHSDDSVDSVSGKQPEPIQSEPSEEDTVGDISDAEESSAAEDVAGDPLASGDGLQTSVAQPSQWVSVEADFSPRKMTFKGTPGLTVPPGSLSPESCPLEFVQHFITKEIIDLMVNETNKYAEQELSKGQLKSGSRKHSWVATNDVEMKHFLGLLIIMGIVVKKNIADYWSTDPVIATPYVNTIMPRNRFQLLLKFWHFANNEDAIEGDRLHKLRNVCNALISRFQALYEPEKELSIDEAMVLFRGRLLFRQYLPGKRHKYGVKLYMLCEPSGYTLNFLVYCGQSDPLSGMSHAESVVMKLMEGRLDVGHELYVDNFYTSVPLAKKLLERQTLVCGTLRRNRKFLPQAVVSSKLKKGEVERRRCGQLVVTKWKDKREVLMLSTLHSGKLVNVEAGKRRSKKGQPIQKPDCVVDYNSSMGGIDRVDQLTSYYTPLRKSIKWYRKVVLHVLDISLLNAYILYKSVGGTKPLLWFRRQAAGALMAAEDRQPMGSVSQKTVSVPRPFFHHKLSDTSRLSGQHYMDRLQPTQTKADPTKRCVVCFKAGRRRETRYFCETCLSQPALCVVPCFKTFHTEQDI